MGRENLREPDGADFLRSLLRPPAETDKLFFVFLSADGKAKIPEGYEAGPIYLADGLFREIRPLFDNPKSSYQRTLQDGRTMKIENSEIRPTASYIINNGYIMHLKKKAK